MSTDTRHSEYPRSLKKTWKAIDELSEKNRQLKEENISLKEMLLKRSCDKAQIIEYDICSRIHRVCNGALFAPSVPVEFASFLNLIDLKEPPKMKGAQKMRVKYLVRKILKAYEPSKRMDDWAESFLLMFGITWDDYAKNHNDMATKAISAKKLKLRGDLNTLFGDIKEERGVLKPEGSHDIPVREA